MSNKFFHRNTKKKYLRNSFETPEESNYLDIYHFVYKLNKIIQKIYTDYGNKIDRRTDRRTDRHTFIDTMRKIANKMTNVF